MDRLQGTSFAEMLQRLRKRARLTQQGLAERIGTHRSTVSFWERGEYVPETLTTVLEIARVLRLTEADKRLLVEARFGTASILPFYNLPGPNPYFTGRDTLLETLHTALTSDEQVALSQMQAISGLGGIGKTQLALAYAYRYRKHYHDIFWAQAESREMLASSYETFAQQLCLDLRVEQERSRAVEGVKRWLREHKNWLLILDNIEDLGLVRAFVPTPRQGAVILTTRRAETSPVARALALDTLSEEEGILFLLRRAGLLPMDAILEAVASEQREIACAIVEALGRLPLAIDQAGAYLAETRCALSDYLTLFKQELHVLLHRRGAVSDEHPESVTTTFALAFECVQQQSEAAGDILRLCAFLAPEAIPLDLFSQEGVELGPTLTQITPLAFNAALETLHAYSLVRRETEQRTLSLHRLAQAVQQAALPESAQKHWAQRAVRLVSAAFPMPEVATWDRCHQLLPHALLCAGHIERWGFVSPEVAFLLYKAGRYLSERASYEQALPLLLQSLTMREQILGSAHPDLVQILDTLAVLFWIQGEYEQALPLAKRALAISERAYGQIHPDVGASLNTLGMLYCDQGKYAEALPFLQRARAIREQTLGPAHPEVAQSLNNLAILYYLQGQYTEALPLYQQALAIWKQTLGPAHPEVATCLNNLANLYRNLGQYQQALPLIQQSLVIREQALGPGHPDVAWSLNGLVNLYRLQGQYEQALPLARRARAILEQSLGSTHPEVAWSLNNLAHLHFAQEQYEQALPFAEQALAIREQALGSTHPETAESLRTLALLYQAQGQDTAAVPLLKRALTILKQTLPDHSNTFATQEQLTTLLHRLEG